MISIDFALLSYTNANENTYSWMLKGLEKEWNVSKNNIATYNHLMPGMYTLLVKAANSNGDWKTTPIKLYITITPPFYATWWFRILCILVTAGILFWIVQRRINSLKEKHQLRNRIASDLHDEIGSTLTSINILSNVSQQAMEHQPQQAKELLQQISSQSKNIQQNMSDIVWSIRPDNEKIENLVVRIREYAAQTLEPLNINTVIEADDTLIARILPMQYRKDILLICKEAINNIAKHADALSVKILLSNGKNKISLTVTDDGKWKGNNSGTGTKSMQERARALGGNITFTITDAGTQLQLVIPIP
jgi:signal transduction histidine kinase